MAIETNELIDVKTLSPFKKFIMTIGNLPTSYLESMTYAELLMWFCNYLQETVIPTVNNNAEAVEEIQGLYAELKSYVDNYFDNLDVQNEINKKLDNMVLDGTLTQLIGSYVQPLLDEQNETIRTLQNQINSVITNPPIPVSSTDDMTDTSKIYVLTTDGKWYYYDGDSWEIGGNYQSTAFNNLVQIKPVDITIQGYLGPTGYINTTAGFKRSDKISIIESKTVLTGKLNQTSGGLNILLIAGYDANETLIYKYFGETGENNINVEIPDGVKYIIVSTQNTPTDYYINTNVDGINYMNNNHDLAQNKQVVTIGTTGYINTSGSLVSTSGFISSDFIPCKYGERIIGHIYGVRDAILYLSYYDEDKHLIEGFKGGSEDDNFEVNLNVKVPIDAKYFRLSSKKDSTYYYIYAFKIINSLDWIDYLDIHQETKDLFVDGSLTDGQVDNITTFNDLTACLMATMNEPDIIHNVYVKSGTYDLYDEMGGLEFLQSIQPDDTAYTINQPWLYNVNLIGRGNVVLTYLPDDEDVADYPLASDLYSPLNVRGNVNIENIEIECQNCRYGIHDETSGTAKYYNTYHNYKNVKVNYIKGISYGNGLGGGFDNGQTYLFENCYFKSTRNNALSFHNRTSTGGNFIFRDCIFVSSITACVRFGNVGTQTKNNVNFSNCYFNGNIRLSIENALTSSTNCYQLYLNNCNTSTITVDDDLGTNDYEPIIVNTIS